MVWLTSFEDFNQRNMFIAQLFFQHKFCAYLIYSDDISPYFYPHSIGTLGNLQGHSQGFSKGGSHYVKVRVFTRLSLWPRYRHGIFAPCFVKKRLAKGGFTSTTGPPLATPLNLPSISFCSNFVLDLNNN